MSTESMIPRASNALTLSLCPGSLSAQLGMEDAPTPDSESGVLIHSHLEAHFSARDRSILTALDARQTYVFDYSKRVVDKIIAAHGGVKTILVEEQIFLKLGREALMSGHPDLVVLCNDGSIHVFDYKTGYLEAPRAAANLQLWVYTLYALRHFIGTGPETEALTSLYNRMEGPLMGHIINPMVKDGVSHMEITETEINGMMARLRGIAIVATRPNAERIPGVTQCNFCLAKGTDACPESSATLKNLPATISTDLTPHQASEVLIQCSVAKKLIEQVQSQAKGLLKDTPDAIHNWVLTDGAKVRHISGIWDAFSKLQQIGITEGEFLQALSFSFGKMSDILYEKRPDMTKSECDKMINATLNPITTKHEKEGSLKYVGDSGVTKIS